MATNVAITQDTSNAYSEADIRYNYSNPSQIIASSNNNNYSASTNAQAQYYSGDGGGTWAQSSLPAQSADTIQGDPAVDWTADGTAWSVCNGVGSSVVVRCFKSVN